MLADTEDEMAPVSDENDDNGGDTRGAVRMQIDVAVLKTQLVSMDKKLDDLRNSLTTSFASKTEVGALTDEVRSLKANQSFIVKLVVGSVLSAIVALVLSKGGGFAH